MNSPNLLPAEHKTATQLVKLLTKEETENVHIDIRKLLLPPSVINIHAHIHTRTHKYLYTGCLTMTVH